MIGRLNVPLFLLALAIAIAIKVGIHEAEEVSEKTIEAKVTYKLPEGVVLVERTKEVEVQLSGRRQDIAQLNPLFVEVLAEVEEKRLGRVEILLDRSNVRTPGDFEIIAIEPNRVLVQVEKVETVVLPIQVKATGEPAAGARVGAIEVKPDWVTVKGPASKLRSLQFMTAEPVSVERRAITFEGLTTVISPDPLIEIEPSRVRVKVEMVVPELRGSLSQEPAPP